MMPPTLKQIEAFYRAATCSNFATAAQRLHLSLSSLSKRISELEAALGVQLFDRRGNRATLTHDGQRLLPVALAALDAAQALQQAAGNQGASLNGTFELGAGELSALSWLPDFAAQVRALHPALQLALDVDMGAPLEQRLAAGKLDLAVIAGRSSRSDILSQPIGRADFEWVAAPALLAGRKARQRDPAALLQELPLITLPAGAGTTRILDDWLMSQQIHHVTRLSCNNWTAVAGMLRRGLGVGFLPCGWALHANDRQPLARLEHRQPLAPLLYSVQWRRSDERPLILAMRELLAGCVDFSSPRENL
ncbi:LysR family transcriptional regulator [Kerstersia gyiorum]|uniref:LysR family transcriptional regulator n=1 Tax=Kerstersia gyiorum TaxID=206506 RepID=UPI0010707FA0|nr:LysR family transcriptional regulator [Kerstersia gyiorum]QBR42358.1 LysR family transcriptional regulator [Kerstersia gyiorum]